MLTRPGRAAGAKAAADAIAAAQDRERSMVCGADSLFHCVLMVKKRRHTKNFFFSKLNLIFRIFGIERHFEIQKLTETFFLKFHHLGSFKGCS